MTSESRTPRIAIGGIIHETHTFAEIRTTLGDFQEQTLYFGDEVLRHMRGSRSGIGGMIATADAFGWRMAPTAYGSAMPGGIVTENALHTILSELIKQLTAQLPVDGVLLTLHGAMVTAEQQDAESYILHRIRQVVGPQIPIVVELDMHGNISQETVSIADVIVAFDTNPHVDAHARGVEAATILRDLLEGQLQPTPALRKVPILLAPQATDTSDLPLRAVHERVTELEAAKEVICICVMAGFAYADTPFTGPAVIVTTDNQPYLAQQLAQELARLLWQTYWQTDLPEFLDPTAAVAEALAQPEGPIILVDSADNIGGGTPGDGTDVLQAMLAHDVENGTIVLADPEAVNACWAVGEDAEITIAVGGKADNWHGKPISVEGTVRRLTSGTFECELADNHFAAFYGHTIKMGRTVWLRVAGVNIVLTEQKTPPFDLAQLRSVGINPEEQRMIVVKSAVAYRAAYLPIAAGVIEMDTAGLCSANLSRFPYRHLHRPVLPLDDMGRDDQPWLQSR